MPLNRPSNQSLAMAYAIQQRNRSRMADGGTAWPEDSQWMQTLAGNPQRLREAQTLSEPGNAQAARDAAAQRLRDLMLGHKGPARRGLSEEQADEYGQRNMEAATAGALDPFGLTSLATSYWNPEFSNDLASAQRQAPSTSFWTGNVASAAAPLGAAFRGLMGAPRTAATAAGSAGMLAAGDAMAPEGGEAQAQFWNQQQQPEQRDRRALDRAQEARDQRARALEEQKKLQLEQRIREGDRNAEAELRKSQESKALSGIPSKEWLEKFKINQGQWLNMAEPERQSVLSEINRQEKQQYQRSIPWMDQNPGTTAGAAVTFATFAVGLAMRGKKLQAQQALNLENKWIEQVAHAKDVIKSGKGGAAESEAIRTLNNYQKELKLMKARFSNEDFKTGMYGTALGAEGAAIPYEFQAWYNPSVLKDQLTSSEFPIRIGAGAFAGGLGAKSTSFAKGQSMFRNLPEVDTRILLGKGQPFANPFDRLFRRDAPPYIVDRPRSNLLPWLAAGGAGAAGVGYGIGRNSGEGKAGGGAVAQIMSRLSRQPSLPALGVMGAGLLGAKSMQQKPSGHSPFDESGFIGANYAKGGGIPGKYGFVAGSAGGRADTRPTGVKGGSYVIPADVVSGLGQGNSMAGAKTLNRMFQMGGVPDVPMPRAQRTPTGPRKYAEGGDVPIQVSDGEYLIPPEKVEEIGQGDIDFGHDILDKFVQQARAKSIQHLSSLPPPKGSEQSFDDGGDVMFEGGGYGGDDMDADASNSDVLAGLSAMPVDEAAMDRDLLNAPDLSNWRAAAGLKFRSMLPGPVSSADMAAAEEARSRSPQEPFRDIRRLRR